VRGPALGDRVARVPLALGLLPRPWGGTCTGEQLLRPGHMQRGLAAETVEDEQQRGRPGRLVVGGKLEAGGTDPPAPEGGGEPPPDVEGWQLEGRVDPLLRPWQRDEGRLGGDAEGSLGADEELREVEARRAGRDGRGADDRPVREHHFEATQLRADAAGACA